MTLTSDGMRTTVWVLPYKKSSVDEHGYVQSIGSPITVRSVDGYEDSLVEIATPNGECIVFRADQLTLAIRKCVFS